MSDNRQLEFIFIFDIEYLQWLRDVELWPED